MAAEVTFVVSVPDNTPKDAKLSFGGDFNNWNPKALGYRLTKMPDGTYRYTFKNLTQGKVLHFKLTRGSWETVEIEQDGGNRENRYYQVKKGKQLVSISVKDWRDLSNKKPPSTVVGHLELLDIELPTFAGIRKLRVYLPSEYHKTTKLYPVIYMSDGQNLFDKALSNAGEWQMDELMEKLASEGSDLTAIIVGIDHAEENRAQEYIPFTYQGRWGKGNGKGKEWADHLVNHIKPLIDQKYRTKSDRNNTTIMGSSMGGLISCYTALLHQDKISKAGCISSAFLKRLVKSNMLDFIKATGKKYPMKIHLDMGDQEFGLFGENILNETQEVYSTLIESGFSENEIRYQVIEGGVHSEDNWRLRTENIIKWLNEN